MKCNEMFGKRAVSLAALFVLSLHIGVASCHAESYSTYSVTATSGGVTAISGAPLLRQSVGVKIGYDVIGDSASDSFGWEAVFNAITGGGSKSGYLYRLDYLVPFGGRRLVPYLAAGAGGMSVDSKISIIASLGGGCKYFINDRFAIRGDLRDTLASGSSNSVEYNVGVSYLFGTTGKAVLAVAADLEKPVPAAAVPEAALPAATVPQSALPGRSQAQQQNPPTATLASAGQEAAATSVAAPKAASPSAAPPISGAGAVVATLNSQHVARQVTIAEDRRHLAAGTTPAAPGYAAADEQEPSLKGLKDVRRTVTILFAAGKWSLRPEDESTLKAVAASIKADPRLQVRIAAHTDDLGTAHGNYLLSQKRARSAKDYLVKVLKVDPRRVLAKGYGAYQPVADNSTATGRKSNRRAVAIVLTMRSKISDGGK